MSLSISETDQVDKLGINFYVFHINTSVIYLFLPEVSCMQNCRLQEVLLYTDRHLNWSICQPARHLWPWRFDKISGVEAHFHVAAVYFDSDFFPYCSYFSVGGNMIYRL